MKEVLKMKLMRVLPVMIAVLTVAGEVAISGRCFGFTYEIEAPDMLKN